MRDLTGTSREAVALLALGLPMIGAAKPRVGARSCCVAIETAPGILP